MAKIKEAIEDFNPDPRLVDDRGATKERLKKANGEIHQDDKRRQYLRDSPIERAVTKAVITAGQYTAATKFQLHWYRAGLSESVGSVDLNRVFGADPSNMSGMAKTEAQAFHRQQYRKATRIVGPRASKVLENVICRELPIEQAGYLLGWSNRPQAFAAAAQILREKLDQLCYEWGIST